MSQLLFLEEEEEEEERAASSNYLIWRKSNQIIKKYGDSSKQIKLKCTRGAWENMNEWTMKLTNLEQDWSCFPLRENRSKINGGRKKTNQKLLSLF